MSETRNSTLEDRLQPWIDRAEYIIALTIIIMAWSAGWVDLLAFESFSGTIFGRYSLPFFIAFVVYSLGFIFWFWLVFSISALDGFKASIAFIQKNPIILVLIVALFSVITWSTIYIAYWVLVPLLQGTVLVIFTVIIVLILFTNPDPDTKMQGWRKLVNGILALFLLTEIILHLLAFVGLSPVQNTGNLFEPYSLVYQNQEGHTYGLTNQYGWYYPDFEISSDNENVILVGDSYLQGLQVSQTQNMGMQLQELVTDDLQIMLTAGVGYGANTYINPTLYQFMWDDLQPDEIILFIHLANDFQYVTEPQSERPYFELLEDGRIRLDPADSVYAHVYEHVIFDGHQPPSLIESAFSYSFLISTLRDYLGTQINPEPRALEAPLQRYWREVIPLYDVDLPIDARSDEMPFGKASFLFETEENELANTAYGIMFAQLGRFQNFTGNNDIDMRIVTIPFFPETFYERQTGTDWDSQFDDYDIFLPESSLVDYANKNDIPIIASGAMMQAEGLSVEEIQSLFFNDGTGHFTAEGHQFFAELVYDCFYSDSRSDCDNP